MKRIYGFLTIGIYAFWILYSAFVQNNLSFYTTERYYNLILFSAFVSAVVCIAGIGFELWKNRRTIIHKENYKLIKDRKFQLFVFSFLIGLIFLPALLLTAALSFIPFKDSEFDKLLNKNFIPSLIIFGILFSGLILPSQSLSSNIASQRSDNLNSVNINGGINIAQNFNTGTKNYNIGDWITSINYNPDPEFYKGKEVEVTGFIFTTKLTTKDNEFFIGRFVIRCCAADAAPIGLKIRSEWKDKFKEGDWIKVTGKFEIDNTNGYEEILILPSNIESTPIPEKPYIS